MKELIKNLIDQTREQSRLLLCVYVPALLLLAVVGIQTQIPVTILTRDTNAIAETPFYTGALSSLGILCWCATATVCFFVFFRGVGRWDPRAGYRFLFWSGLLTLLLMLDDLFMLHEVVFPEYLGVPDKVVVIGLGLMTVIIFLVYRQVILASDYLFVLLAAGFFMVSVVTDVVQTQYLPVLWRVHPNLLEDGSKLLGILSWLVYFARLGNRTLDAD